MKKSSLSLYFLHLRSLLLSMAPVMVGTAMAHGDGFFHRRVAAAALAVAVCVHSGAILFKSGVKAGAVAAFALAAVAANILIIRAGTPALVIAVAAIVAGSLYASGRWSLSCLGLGDLAVLFFFGPVAVAGTYYVQSFEYNGAVIISGFMTGFFSVAVLAVNNLRDIISDANAGKRTTAVRFEELLRAWSISFVSLRQRRYQ